jgi:hypothetical protein
MIDVLN